MKNILIKALELLKKNDLSNQSTSKFDNSIRSNVVNLDLDEDMNPNQRRPIPPKDVYFNKEVWGIGSNVQLRREALKLTQKELSELLGYKSTSFVSKLELWELEKIKHEQIENLARCLKTSVDELLNAKYWF